MGALLERHGIGNGKYKVGGLINSNVLRLNSQRGIGERIFRYNHIESSANLTAVEAGENGNFYVGSTGGNFNLTKYDALGNVLWQSNHLSNVSYIKYDKFDDIIWFTNGSNTISSFDLNGNLIMDIPVTFNNLREIQVTQNNVLLGVFGGTTSQQVIRIFDKSGVNTGNLSYIRLKSFNVKGDFIYLSDTATLKKVNFSGVESWSLNTISGTGATATHSNITLDDEGKVYLYTGITSANSELIIANDSDGSMITRIFRNSANITPDATNNTEDIPYQVQAYLLGNDADEPVFYTWVTGTGTIRGLNPIGHITFRSTIEAPNTQTLIGNKTASMDVNKRIYYVTNKDIYLVDANIYYKIKK